MARRRRDVCNIPPGMFSAGEIQRLLIGCCTQVGGSAVRTSHIRRDPTVCQVVVAAPVTGSRVSISWLNLRETAGNVFSPQKRTYGGTDQSKGIVFLVWIQLITEDCSMNTATSVLPWDAMEEVVDVSVAGVEIQPWFPDAMGLEGHTGHATRSGVLRGRDPRSVRVLIPVGQGPDQSVHDVTIVDMGKLPEPHVSILQLAELIHIWPPAVINHMTWRQREMERMWSVAKKELKDNSRKPCTFCGASIKINMYRHVVRCHLQLAQLWRCPIPWCTIWKGTSQDLMTHIVLGHKVPGEAKRTDLQKLFPPLTVTREQYAESLSPKHSGISNDVLLFSEVGLTLVHHYRVHSAGQPHAVFRGKYLAQLRLLHLTGSTTPAPEKPLSNASPQVTHVSGKIDDSWARLRPPSEKPRGNAGPQVPRVSGKIDHSCTRLRPPSEKPRGNAGPQVTHVSGRIDDSCARLRPPSEMPLGNAGPQVTHVSGKIDDSCARIRPPGRRRRSQRWIPNTAMHVASRFTEQDLRTMAGAVVFDCRPAVLPVLVDVSGIDMQTVRRAEPPAEPVVAPTEREQESTAPMWLNDIDPELEATPLLDSGTDCQDELSSPDGSPMVISPIAGLLPSQGEDDINLARIPTFPPGNAPPAPE